VLLLLLLLLLLVMVKLRWRQLPSQARLDTLQGWGWC
jgi:hypothetical protein